ncbi:MAG TPA: carboxypeptidase-like regulatory domain-containing protein, partial [Puia sp.]|nr:carboxypeptidase-like regulatory domain-containing protein [Puia sp.]
MSSKHFRFLFFLLFAAGMHGSANGLDRTVTLSTEKVVNPGIRAIPIVIKGVVKDEDGKPLSGASVVVKGTQSGTTTNEKGEFSLTVDDKAKALVISFAGMASSEVSFKNKSYIIVSLKPSYQDSKEVVVVAFGSKSKTTLIESVTKVDDNIIKDKPVNNIISALQGQVAGVNITS